VTAGCTCLRSFVIYQSRWLRDAPSRPGLFCLTSAGEVGANGSVIAAGVGGSRGARFTWDLLGARDPDSGGAKNHEPGSDRWSGPDRERILVVEDDRGIREVLRGILEEEGYAVTTADNGRRALDRLLTGEVPDIIVLDLRMPIMDGWQFRAAQKADPALAGIPVLAMSADGSAKAEAIDAAAYLRKPLSTGILLAAIRQILGDMKRRRVLGRLEDAERLAAIGRLAASVGHEINNPLASMSMHLDLVTIHIKRYLADAVVPPEELADLPVLLKECRDGVDRVRDVVKDLQRLSHTSGHTRETFALNPVVDESLAMARNDVRHRAAVSKDYGDLPMVVGDRSAIGQVLLNLILNAAQSLPDGRADTNLVRVKTYAKDNTVVVEVSDTGPGIPADVLPHVFDPFFTTKPIGDAPRFALALSYRIVADHGGRIDVSSEEGRGSLFRVVLPIGRHPSQPPEPNPSRN
jgi:signal transduction histidine kinase